MGLVNTFEVCTLDIFDIALIYAPNWETPGIHELA